MKSLESAADHERAALSPRPLQRTWDVEAECLGAALSDVLSPFAYRFLVAYAKARIEEVSGSGDGGPAEPLRRDARRRRWTSLDSLGFGESEPDGRVWFVGEIDEQYRREVAEAHRQREAQALSRAEHARELVEREAREKQHLQEERDREVRAEKERRQRELRSERKEAAAARAEAERKAREAEQLNQERVARHERESAQRQREWQKWQEAKRQRAEKDAEARRKEEEAEASRAAWEEKRRAKESPARLQRAGVRVGWRNG
jgi:hypothetical protein